MLERPFDREELGFQVRPLVLILDVHRSAENDEPAKAIDLRSSVRISFEVVKTNPMAARPNERVERSERLDGDVLKDQEARHRPAGG